MVFVVLVYWTVKKGLEDEFIRFWKTRTVSDKSAFVGEFLSKVELPDGYNTWDLSVDGATTFINVGIWKSMEDFKSQIGKYISSRERFEQKFRVRAMLTPFIRRKGEAELETVTKDVEFAP